MSHIPKNSYDKIKQLFDDGFSITELAIMYKTSLFKIERVLENE